MEYLKRLTLISTLLLSPIAWSVEEGDKEYVEEDLLIAAGVGTVLGQYYGHKDHALGVCAVGAVGVAVYDEVEEDDLNVEGYFLNILGCYYGASSVDYVEIHFKNNGVQFEWKF